MMLETIQRILDENPDKQEINIGPFDLEPLLQEVMKFQLTPHLRLKKEWKQSILKGEASVFGVKVKYNGLDKISIIVH